MTSHEHLFANNALVAAKRWIRSIGLELLAWAGTCSDYWAAATLYEELSALSDAELTRRGLSRATLPNYVRAAAD